ncbi:endonuclease domain-containing protein [Modestobacter sp. URMC 112]
MPRRRAPTRVGRPLTRPAARTEGITDWQLRHPDVIRLSRDTYLPRHDDGDVRTRLPAILMTAPAGAVISHQTAAALWRVKIPLQRTDRPAHLIVPADSKARNRRDRRLHRVPLRPDEVDRWWGLPVTTPARTWRDLAAELEPAALLAVTDQLLDVLCRPADLEQALGRAPAGRGAARCRRVLAVADPNVDSPMESVVRWLLHEAGLPRPNLQYQAFDDSGRQIGFGDMAWPDRKVLLEFDGDVHRERRVFVGDLRRQNRLVLEGWIVLRFSSADVLGRPHELVAAVRRALRL